MKIKILIMLKYNENKIKADVPVVRFYLPKHGGFQYDRNQLNRNIRISFLQILFKQ